MNMTLTGLGTLASPYVFKSDVIVSPTAGNALSITPNGLYSSGGAVAASTACMTAAGTGTAADPITMTPNTSPWTFACQDTNGDPIHCASDGKLRAEPPHTTQALSVGSGGTQIVPTTAVACGATNPIGTQRNAAMTFTNPSPCRSMTVHLYFSPRLRIATDATLTATYAGILTSEHSINGGAFQQNYQSTFDHVQGTGITSRAGGTNSVVVFPVTLAPAAAMTISTRFTYRCTGAQSQAQQVVLNPPGIEAYGVTV